MSKYEYWESVSHWGMFNLGVLFKKILFDNRRWIDTPWGIMRL